jgi:hypothetical protein
MAVFTSGGSGPAITTHGSLDLKQEIQIQTPQVSGKFNSGVAVALDLRFDRHNIIIMYNNLSQHSFCCLFFRFQLAVVITAGESQVRHVHFIFTQVVTESFF